MKNKSILDIIEEGLRGNTIDELVEGWSFRIEEISSNVYKVDGIDKEGHRVSGYDIDPEKVLTQCVKDAQRIIQQTKFITNAKTNIAKILRFKK